MNKLLILYPAEFNCSSKFERKVKHIIATLSNFEVVFSNDDNFLIKNLFDQYQQDIALQQNINWNKDDFTHAIIFDDGEVFIDELVRLKESGKPFRVVKIAISRVVNVDRDKQYKGVKTTKEFEYIGRGSYWGNPHSMFEDGDDRDEVIRKYKYDFDYEKFPHIDKKEVYKLVGKRLGCFCKPASCHGDVLADFLNTWDDGK
jgi:hypothetical protein